MALRERARAALRVARILEGLDPADCRALANEIHHAYGGPMTGKERTAKWRDEIVTDAVTKSSPTVTVERHPTPLHARDERTRVLSTSGYSPGFLEFWQYYPKRVGKGEAFKAWTKGNCEVISDAVLKAVREQNGYLNREGGQFTPLPATWLNQRRWEDEPPTPSSLSSKTAGNVESLRRAAIRLKGGDPDATP